MVKEEGLSGQWKESDGLDIHLRKETGFGKRLRAVVQKKRAIKDDA